MADVQSAKQRLQELVQQKEYEQVAQLAWARIGVESSVKYTIKSFEDFKADSEQNRIIKVTKSLRNLAYIRLRQ
jgi:hypothetical protein